MSRPRARYLDGSGEVALSTYNHFSTEDLLRQLALERMVAGLSTRNYPAGLEPVGDVEAIGTKRSSVSRRFVERTQSALKELMQRDLSELNIVALLLDGVEIAEHTMVLALGVDDQGRKHPLGLREGTSENKGVCQGRLATYLLPFPTVSQPAVGDVAAYALFLMVAGIVYVRSEMTQVHPTLYLLGRRVVHVDTEQGWKGHIVIRSMAVPGVVVRTVPLNSVRVEVRRRPAEA